ncbi:RCC1-like G exchanging factor-like protein [Patella vulgata]|uniref:RCC1-like G exchanging factor-like protein n=1 Tax=Patella vulgata TaxID=6465 RepID=UPI00217F427B|nr:RCC1-like G exchanging factor-like protein [Patella vulgata]XP_050405564.1 RCC1-like G exchanging factor-like protein [Patella vulgata]XP_050405565.1 RCC1-like G exchanging factor-like protein [Patella vulgata]XP_050405566.1 RCC1-like G exchanging factor-like protein [Patella vulgata]XP_050405573.1 RCC1-like G exchanging factor-like protein [Patella vulgata]XP_050405581.1 RCC1-like G exchanging factor-like protein [Patella vulgata]
MKTNIHQTVLNQLKQLLRVKDTLFTLNRSAGSYKQRILKREDIKEEITQYIGENAKQAQRVYVWGCAATGALGIAKFLRPEKGHRPLMQVKTPSRMKSMNENNMKVYDVSCGYGFTVYAVKKGNKHSILGTGINTDSQIGYHEQPRNSGRILDYVIGPTQIYLPLKDPDTTRVSSMSCGRAHTVIVTEGEGVYSLGNNAYGQCGRSIVPEEVFRKNPRVNVLTDLPDNIVKVECGQDHTMFLTEEGHVYSCGLGADGQTGLGHYNNIDKPTRLKGDIEGEKIVSISSKGDCVLGISENGEVFGWGNSEYNQLSMVTEETQVNIPRHLPITKYCGKIIKAVAGGSVCAILNSKNEVYVWGYGILGKGPKLDMCMEPSKLPQALFGQNELQPEVKVLDIVCGLGHFVALTDKGDIFSWGKNKYGCIGLGKETDQFFPLKVSLPAEAVSVYCGVDHTVALAKSFC